MTGRTGYDVVVLGGGSAGAAVAARLVQAGASVCLVEAGPDYGPFAAGRWPADLLDPGILPTSHDWHSHGEITTSRARVVGGCSAHNGCWCVRPSTRDIDDYVSDSDGSWSVVELRAALDRAEARLAPRRVTTAELTPVAAAAVAAAGSLGVARLADVNAPDALDGIGCPPVNVHHGARWNTRFAYLDRLSGRPELVILADHLVDRLEWRGGRCPAVVTWHKGQRRVLHGDRVVLCTGAYGTPPILLRSGVGPEDELRRHGIAPVQVLAGVGAGLADHVGAGLTYAASDALVSATDRHLRERGFRPSQVVWKSRSSGCPRGTWDQFILPIPQYEPSRAGRARYSVTIQAFAMRPRSRGRLRLASPDPDRMPLIDTNFLADGHDLDVVLEALAKARVLAATPELADYLAVECFPGAEAVTQQELAAHVRQTVRGYWHAAGTCAMRPPGHPGGVTGPDGRVRGLDNVHVADASLLPAAPSGNPHLPVVAVAELVAARIARCAGSTPTYAHSGRTRVEVPV